PVVISLLSKEPLRFMTNANQFEGFQGWLIKRLGAFPINLEHPQISSFRTAIALLHEGKKLVMFPEGGIVRDRVLRSLKPGLARLVLQAEASYSEENLNIPIIPIAIKYEPDAVRGAKICIEISSPIYTHQHTQQKDKETAIALTSALETALMNSLESATI
ncbi:MAG: lysophospholipid acyltransferase family protein, partial [Oscillatoria sp. PMC 1068.18]|nr:lysophospholipid acyltransferase family protein [Oscillatoria sp. PMC 1068.18]